jgi:hypothetical protein
LAADCCFLLTVSCDRAGAKDKRPYPAHALVALAHHASAFEIDSDLRVELQDKYLPEIDQLPEGD